MFARVIVGLMVVFMFAFISGCSSQRPMPQPMPQTYQQDPRLPFFVQNITKGFYVKAPDQMGGHQLAVRGEAGQAFQQLDAFLNAGFPEFIVVMAGRQYREDPGYTRNIKAFMSQYGYQCVSEGVKRIKGARRARPYIMTFRRGAM